ncbi:MAG TPA: MBL fold metallo-hydrolase [Thermomicrobiales bacterium]|nr:MBL fold metallo-hydrolase [Thermomicrobiales bacterium]
MATFEVEPLADGVRWIRGVMPDNVMFKPDIANAYIIERGDGVTIVDTGAGTEFRQVLRRYFAGRSYTSATVINTHFHPDHVCNNIVLDEIDAQQKMHLIHPNAVPLIDLAELVAHEVRLSAAQEYWVVKIDRPFALKVGSAVARAWVRRWPRSAHRFVFPIFGRLNIHKHKPIGSRTRHIAPLNAEDRRALRIGSQEFQGWRAGDMLIIDDHGHTADSVSVYDTGSRMLLTGDLTFEDNPLWPSGTYGRMIANLRALRTLAAEGEVGLFGDGHLPRVMTDSAEMVAHFDALIATHERRRAAVLDVARRHNLHTVDDVQRALLAENTEFQQLSRAGEFPMAYRWTRAIVALALREAREEQASDAT